MIADAGYAARGWYAEARVRALPEQAFATPEGLGPRRAAAFTADDAEFADAHSFLDDLLRFARDRGLLP